MDLFEDISDNTPLPDENQVTKSSAPPAVINHKFSMDRYEHLMSQLKIEQRKLNDYLGDYKPKPEKAAAIADEAPGVAIDSPPKDVGREKCVQPPQSDVKTFDQVETKDKKTYDEYEVIQKPDNLSVTQNGPIKLTLRRKPKSPDYSSTTFTRSQSSDSTPVPMQLFDSNCDPPPPSLSRSVAETNRIIEHFISKKLPPSAYAKLFEFLDVRDAEKPEDFRIALEESPEVRMILREFTDPNDYNFLAVEIYEAFKNKKLSPALFGNSIKMAYHPKVQAELKSYTDGDTPIQRKPPKKPQERPLMLHTNDGRSIPVPGQKLPTAMKRKRQPDRGPQVKQPSPPRVNPNYKGSSQSFPMKRSSSTSIPLSKKKKTPLLPTPSASSMINMDGVNQKTSLDDQFEYELEEAKRLSLAEYVPMACSNQRGEPPPQYVPTPIENMDISGDESISKERKGQKVACKGGSSRTTLLSNSSTTTADFETAEEEVDPFSYFVSDDEDQVALLKIMEDYKEAGIKSSKATTSTTVLIVPKAKEPSVSVKPPLNESLSSECDFKSLVSLPTPASKKGKAAVNDIISLSDKERVTIQKFIPAKTGHGDGLYLKELEMLEKATREKKTPLFNEHKRDIVGYLVGTQPKKSKTKPNLTQGSGSKNVLKPAVAPPAGKVADESMLQMLNAMEEEDGETLSGFDINEISDEMLQLAFDHLRKKN